MRRPLDEMQLQVLPILLGQGRRLFDHLGAEHVELEVLRRMSANDVDDFAQRVIHLRYLVERAVPHGV